MCLSIPSIAVFDLILGYDIACRWQGITLNFQFSIFNSQFDYTPQSLRDSPPTLVGQLFFAVNQLDMVIALSLGQGEYGEAGRGYENNKGKIFFIFPQSFLFSFFLSPFISCGGGHQMLRVRLWHLRPLR